MAAQRKRVRTKARGGRWRAFATKIGGRNLPWWLTTIRWIAFLGVSAVVLGALGFFILYKSITIPDANADFQTQTTNVYYSDGKHKIGSFATQDRESIPIAEMPASMQAAAIAAEDRTFYTNRGIDIKGIIRAARDNATSGEITGGGSTITQQYVKILYLNQEQSYTRKVKEAILSIKIHNQLSKKEILEGYLNTIYFGNGAYGVEVAAQTYFRKPASELTVPESAALASIINSPSYYDPYAEGAAERLIPRYNYVLDGMVKSKALDATEAAKYRDKLPKFEKKRDNNRYSGTKGYLLTLVKKRMQHLQFTDSQIDGGGLRIVTTFDYDKQKDAVAAVKQVQPKGLKELHTAVVSVQPGTGAVRALYGGPDYLKSQINWATWGTQPGSTFKAFAVVAALEDGYSLKTKLNGSSPLIIDGKAVTENQGDSGGESFGNIPLLKATQKSVNTAFVDLMDQMTNGPTKTLEAAAQAGLPASVLDKEMDADGPPLVTPLGYFKVAPIDMATGYATIAAQGKKADWYVIEKVTDFRGKSLHRHAVKTEQTIPKDVAADTIAALRAVVNSGRAGTGSTGRTICATAGKTGTATAGPDNDQHVSSSWFAGFTPKLATAVMYNRGKGNEDLEGYLRPFYGGTYPAMTFKAYMNAALDGSDCGTFPKAANIKSTKGTVYKKPAPKCDSDEHLNGEKTKCIKNPTPICDSNSTPNPTNTGCVPKPCAQGEVGGTMPNCHPPASDAECVQVNGNGWTWNGSTCVQSPVPPTCDDKPGPPLPDCPTTPPNPGNGGGWIFLPVLAGMLGLGRRRDDDPASHPGG